MIRSLLPVLILFLVPGIFLAQKPGDCQAKKTLPVSQCSKKYKVEYQSGTGPDCRMYQARNQAGGVATPFSWSDTTETFLQFIVPRAPKDGKAPSTWLKVGKPSDAAEKGDSELAYGVNYDEVKEKTKAYREQVKKGEGEAKKHRPLVTRIEGEIGDDEGNPIYLDITVVSVVRAKEEGLSLEYSFSLGRGSTAIRIPTGKLLADNKNLQMKWESADSEPYNAKAAKIDSPTLREGHPFVGVSFQAKQATVKKKDLVIYKGKTRLLRTTAPAYNPGE